MEFTTIHGTDIRASRIALGTWSIGGWMWGGTETGQAIATLRTAFERGITTIDTAPVYGFGEAEHRVGRALAEHGRRDEVVVATKGGLKWNASGEIVRNSDPERLRTEVEASLDRLGTDYIDLYQVHWPDPRVPYEEVSAELELLREAGKIRAIGVSNFSPDQMEAFRRGGSLHACQPPYNLFERGIEAEVLPYCRERGLTVLAYGALSRGLLSGAMSQGRRFTGDDLRREDPKFQGRRFDHYLAAVERLDALAREHHGKRVIHLALRWLLDRGIDIALWGARRPEQLDPVGEIEGWSLSDEEMEEIDRILEETIPEPVGPEFMAPPLPEESPAR